MALAERTCAVCGRTILPGEHVRGYVAPDGPRPVCELCVARAERLGWRPEGQAEAGAPRPARQRRGLGAWLRRRGSRAGDEPVAEPDPPPATGDDAPVPSPDSAPPARRPERPRPDFSQASPFERAIARFNASEAGHTVAGLIRTLGTPWVSVGASAGAPQEMRITVAWELSWYQWGVDLADELRPVFQIDKGQEIAQLDAAAQQWNASAGEDGRIVLGTPGRRPAGTGAGA